MQFSQKLLFTVKKSFTKRSAWSKNFSRLAKICSPRQLFSLLLLGQNAAWTNLLPVKKNREKTNTPLRVVKNQEKANNSPGYRCAAINRIRFGNFWPVYVPFCLTWLIIIVRSCQIRVTRLLTATKSRLLKKFQVVLDIIKVWVSSNQKCNARH